MILVTGSSGFIGRALVEALIENGFQSLVISNRTWCSRTPGFIKQIAIGDLNGSNDWSAALEGVDTVIHVAGKAHVADEDLLGQSQFKVVNTDATRNLVIQAANSGVRRFIYLSSVKVNGEFSKAGKPFKFDDVPRPHEPYGVSKYKAEKAIAEVAIAKGMEYVILRPVLVYGPGVKANFSKMINLVKRQIPLPVGRVNNARSFLAIENLVDLILNTIHNESAANQIFMVSDDDDVSTTLLFQLVREALQSKTILVIVPQKLLWVIFGLIGKKGIARRLLESLHVDITHTRETLGWNPPVKMKDAIVNTVQQARKGEN